MSAIYHLSQHHHYQVYITAIKCGNMTESGEEYNLTQTYHKESGIILNMIVQSSTIINKQTSTQTGCMLADSTLQFVVHV